MIKKDIVRIIYERHGGFTFNEVETHVNTLVDLVKQTFAEGESLTITNFGKFRHKEKVVRPVKLPSGKILQSSAGKRIQFIPSPRLKTRINAFARRFGD